MPLETRLGRSSGFSETWASGHVEDRLGLSERQLRVAYSCTYLNRSTLKRFSSVVDAGCGSGYLCRYLERLGWHGRYRGVDWSVASLSAATRMFPRAQFVRGDLTALPFPSNTFDLGYARDSVMHCSLPREAITELYRVSNAVLLRARVADVPDIFTAEYRNADIVHQWFGLDWLVAFVKSLSPAPLLIRYNAQTRNSRVFDPSAFRESAPFTHYGAVDLLVVKRQKPDPARVRVIDDTSGTVIGALWREWSGWRNYCQG